MQGQDFTMAVLGVGNMGEALLGGVLRAGITPKERVIVYDASAERLAKIAEQFGVRAATGCVEAAADSEVVLLAVKPQNLPAIQKELQGKFHAGQLVISILAGMPVSKLRAALGPEPTIVRVMPNLPALIGQGMSVVADDAAEPEQVELVKSILATVGGVVALPEKHLDAVTAVSGSGPGFVYLFIEALAEAGEAAGLPREESRKMAAQTFIGACQLLERSGEPPEELRRRVTSPGGTTEAGIQAFEELRLRDVFRAAIERSTRRAEELGRG